MKPRIKTAVVQRRRQEYTEGYFTCPICKKETILGDEKFANLLSEQNVYCQFCHNPIKLRVN